MSVNAVDASKVPKSLENKVYFLKEKYCSQYIRTKDKKTVKNVSVKLVFQKLLAENIHHQRPENFQEEHLLT